MPTQPKPKTIKRAGWMSPFKWYAVDADGTKALYTHKPHLFHGGWLAPNGTAFVLSAKAKPPKDPASTLRRIRD